MSMPSLVSTLVLKSKFDSSIKLSNYFINQRKKIEGLDADSQGTLGKWSKVGEYMIDSGDQIPSWFVAGVRGEAWLELANDKKQQKVVLS